MTTETDQSTNNGSIYFDGYSADGTPARVRLNVADGYLFDSTNGAAHVAEVGLSGVWTSQVFSGAAEASGTVNSVSIPANAIAAKVAFNDIGSSVLTKLGVVIGAYTEAQAGTEIAALFAGNSGSAHQLAIGNELEMTFTADDAVTLIGWNSTGADTGANEVIVSWKVAS